MTQQPSLHAVRRQLGQLGRARRVRRWLCGLSTLLTALLWVLATVLLMDVLFELDRFQRVTVFLLAAATLCWAICRFVRPYFGQHESEVDLALLMERLHGIDTDLVAAIEFTRPEAICWGSATLRDEVIGNVARRGRQLKMGRGVDGREPMRRLGTLLMTLTVAAVLVAVFPQHLSVFMRRLALADDHYPSRTVIGSIVVNDQLVLRPQDGLSPHSIRCPERGSVEFLVRCARHAPESGELVISEISGSGRRCLPLARRDPDLESGVPDEAVFVAQLPMLLDSLHYQVYLGDAWTNPGLIELVPLPQIEIRTVVFPPVYTGAQENSVPVEGAYRMTVLEGSRVELAVTSANEKRLQVVWIELHAAGQSERRELENTDKAGIDWQLNSATFPPLHSIQDTVRFTVHATDQDGLRPMRLPRGEIRVQSDLPPDAIAATIHHVVLPMAKPRVVFRVHDDFGIGRLRVRLQIERRAHAGDVSPDETLSSETHWLELDTADFPMQKAELPYNNRYVLGLEPWQLHKGDRIKVTLEATDYRGPAAGASVMSKPLCLEVSDQAGVLAAILEADHRTEKDLDKMIQRQLGLGE